MLLLSGKDSFKLTTHLLLRSETERRRETERLAAIAIQTNWRMLKVKWMY